LSSKEIAIMNQSLTIATVAALSLGLATVAPTAVLAQASPMDMSWAIQSQIQIDPRRQEAGDAAAMNYFRYMQRLRSIGHAGPSLPSGVTPLSLPDSNDAANQAGMAHNREEMLISKRPHNAIRDYDLRAIRGCTYAVELSAYVCP
jgi:hypothetical protein